MSPGGKTARLMLVDDHPIVRRGLAEIISTEHDLEVCAQAGSMREAASLFSSHQPDLVLLDISLGTGNGLSLIKELKARREDVKVLVLSMHDENMYAERALKAGARGYIMKEQATEQVLDAIRSVLAGNLHLSPEMSTRVLGKSLTGSSSRDTATPVSSLTDRELEVFEMIGRGMGTREIADELCISPKTVEAHRAHIKGKLNLCSAIQLLQYATQWVNG